MKRVYSSSFRADTCRNNERMCVDGEEDGSKSGEAVVERVCGCPLPLTRLKRTAAIRATTTDPRLQYRTVRQLFPPSMSPQSFLERPQRQTRHSPAVPAARAAR